MVRFLNLLWPPLKINTKNTNKYSLDIEKLPSGIILIGGRVYP
jgi:hypothetical protein